VNSVPWAAICGGMKPMPMLTPRVGEWPPLVTLPTSWPERKTG
jgi:hypothetical protein